jgi:hypothetical protein
MGLAVVLEIESTGKRPGSSLSARQRTDGEAVAIGTEDRTTAGLRHRRGEDR